MLDDELDTIASRADSLTEDHERLLVELVALRMKHKITQAVVAERMGVSQPTVAGLERYDANPTLSTIRRYALAVGARLQTTVIDDYVTPPAVDLPSLQNDIDAALDDHVDDPYAR